MLFHRRDDHFAPPPTGIFEGYLVAANNSRGNTAFNLKNGIHNRVDRTAVGKGKQCHSRRHNRVASVIVARAQSDDCGPRLERSCAQFGSGNVHQNAAFTP